VFATFIVRVEVSEPPVTGLMLNVQVIPEGQLLLKATFSVKPPEGVIVITVLPVLPR
jgi:hypothetical protein